MTGSDPPQLLEQLRQINETQAAILDIVTQSGQRQDTPVTPGTEAIQDPASIIPRVRVSKNGKWRKLPVTKPDIERLIDPTGQLDEQRVEAMWCTIRTICNETVQNLARDIGAAENFKLTWRMIPKDPRKQAIAIFESAVAVKTRIRFDLCEAHWAAYHMLSETWYNRRAYRSSGDRRLSDIIYSFLILNELVLY